VPPIKHTPTPAMGAWDVSRPRPEQRAAAEAAEASIAAGSRAKAGEAANQARGEDRAKIPRPPATAGDERAGRPRFPRRRRGRAPR
jgi:hypothetical protein